jgi:acyl-CoA synthetase (AMP-forming)/AMP-acid ligase II
MARKMQEWLGLSPADRSACILPIYYNAGFKATLLVPLLMGCSVALPATTNSQEFDQWVAELRPTWLTAAPAFLQAVLERIRAVGKPADALRFVLSTASYLSEGVRTELERLLDIPVVEFYGLCEAGMMTAPRCRRPSLGTALWGAFPRTSSPFVATGSFICRQVRSGRSYCAGRASRRAICSISTACSAGLRTVGCRPATSAWSTRTAS